MHELSVAVELVNAAETAARQANAASVETVYLRLGVMSGVVKEALLFAYDIATENTLLAGSKLEVEDVPLIVYCSTCKIEVELPSIQLFACPHCGTPSIDIRQGREIEIESMEIMQNENETIGS